MGKLYRSNLSRTALVALLDLISCQNEAGVVQAYYKDMVALAGCSTAQYYNVLNDLEDMGFIEKAKNRRYKREMEIAVLENNFSNGYRDYVDINKTFFTERLYTSMSAGEIRCFLYFLFRASKQKFDGYNDRNKLYYGKAYAKIAKAIGITKRMLKAYCKELDNKGLICRKKKQDRNETKYDIITLNKEMMHKPTVRVSEKGKRVDAVADPLFQHWKHVLKNLCRRHNKSYDEDNLNDAALLFKQYKKKAEQSSKDIYGVMENAVLNLKNDILQSKTLHFIVKSLIGLDYAESIIAY